MRRMSVVLLAAAAIGFGGLRAEAQTPSIWTDIMSKKKLTVCIVPSYQPYSWKDPKGEWQGFVAEMARNVAGAMRVEPEFIETTFRTVVLDLQSAKCHVFFGFNATPERALAIDFSGPLYTLGFGFVNGKGFKAPGPGLGRFQLARHQDLLSDRDQHGATGEAGRRRHSTLPGNDGRVHSRAANRARRYVPHRFPGQPRYQAQNPNVGD